MLKQFVSRWMAIVTFASLLAAPPVVTAQNPPQLAVYRGAAPSAPTAVDNYSNWLSQPDIWAEEFLSWDSWDQISGANWLLTPWQNWVAARPGRVLILGVPMLPVTGNYTMEAGATGAYNSYFQTLAQRLVARNMGNTHLRIGWEFNGGWYRWAAYNKQATYIAYFQQIVTAMRSVPGAQNLKFVWNPALGYLQFPGGQAYPGNDYVDFIALDVYDASWSPNTYPFPAGATPAQIEARRATVWNELLNGNHGLVYWKNFAAARGKPFAIGEWGVHAASDGHGGLDNAQFITNMHNFIMNPANNVAWAVYFDWQAQDGHHQLSPNSTEFPLASARFLELFSGIKFSDDFTDGNVSDWSPTASAQWSVTADAGDNVYKWDFNWTVTSGSSFAGNAAWTNFRVTTDMKITDLQAWSENFIYARYTDSNNFYRLFIQDRGGYRRAQLQKRVAGTLTNIGTTANVAVNANVWNELALDLQGSTITAFLNGVQILQVTDTSLSSGKIGFGAKAQDVLYDNVEVK